jgi:hypothetical protein
MGAITGIKEGQVMVTATTKSDATIFYSYPITVKARTTEVNPDMGGYTIEIMVDQVTVPEVDPNHPNYTGGDQAEKLEAWNFIQTAYNVKFSVVPYPTEAPWGPSRTSWIINKAANKDVKADFFIAASDWVKTLADGNAVVDTTEFYNLYGENTMDTAFKTATSYGGKLYGVLSGGVGGINVDKGMFYNFNLIKSLGLESPAKLFNEGKWTYADFEKYVDDADEALGEGKTVLSGMPALYYLGMVNAAGVRLVETNTLEMNFESPYAIQAAQILRDIYVDHNWGTMDWDEKVTTFRDGNSIFQSAEYWFVKNAMRFPDNMWGTISNTQYGYVPYPYPNNMNKEDTRTLNAGVSCFMQANERALPANVTLKDTYRAFATMFLRTGDNLLAGEDVDEISLMKKAAMKKLDDPASIDAIVFFTRNKVIFDPTYGMLAVFGAGNIGPSMIQIVRDGYDYNQVINTMKPLYEARMGELFS